MFFRHKLGSSQLWQWVALEAMDTELSVTPSSGLGRSLSHSLGPARPRGRYSPNSGAAVPDRDTTRHLCPCRAGHLFVLAVTCVTTGCDSSRSRQCCHPAPRKTEPCLGFPLQNLQREGDGYLDALLPLLLSVNNKAPQRARCRAEGCNFNKLLSLSPQVSPTLAISSSPVGS